MRVTNSSIARNYTSSVNDVHSRLNKSMNKVSSGKAYEAAADNPLAYYEGKKIDNQYQDILGKITLIGDIKNRLYQQELGARDIQSLLSDAKIQVEYARNETSGQDSTLDTFRENLLQKQQAMVNDLNSQYQDLYIFGGNDLSTPPFSLSADGTTLTYTHQFTGEQTPTTISMKLEKQPDGSYKYNIPLKDMEAIKKAMKEQGRVDIGYGDISDTDTLLDTYTGGLNLLTGITSDAAKAGASDADILDALNNSPVALVGQAALAIGDYLDGNRTKGELDSTLADTMDAMTETEHRMSTVYADLGNKYSLLEDTADKLTIKKNSLIEEYTDKLGADPYEAIMEMFSNQNSYQAALQVGSYLFGSSLFDFMS